MVIPPGWRQGTDMSLLTGSGKGLLCPFNLVQETVMPLQFSGNVA